MASPAAYYGQPAGYPGYPVGPQDQTQAKAQVTPGKIVRTAVITTVASVAITGLMVAFTKAATNGSPIGTLIIGAVNIGIMVANLAITSGLQIAAVKAAQNGNAKRAKQLRVAAKVTAGVLGIGGAIAGTIAGFKIANNAGYHINFGQWVASGAIATGVAAGTGLVARVGFAAVRGCGAARRQAEQPVML